MNDYEFTIEGEDDSNVTWVRRSADGAVFGVARGARLGWSEVWLTFNGAGSGIVGGSVHTRDTHATMREWPKA